MMLQRLRDAHQRRLEPSHSTTHLRRTLTALDLVLYGVGSSVGAGIYVLVGLGAVLAGPAISLSFALCGLACVLTSLSYADFAAKIPLTGSAYTYCYVALGEVWAWMVGWNLILNYGVSTSVVARAWADYTAAWAKQAFGWTWMDWLAEFPLLGEEMGYHCSPLSTLIVGINTLILLRGVQDSSVFNNVMTILNLSVLLLVVVAGLASRSIQIDNLKPFVPHEWGSVLEGAGLVFFAFIGFDMVASLGEEVIHPQVNLPIGIVGSLLVSTLLYVSVSLAVVGMAPVSLLGDKVPIIHALLANGCCTHDEQLASYASDVCLACDDSALRPLLVLVARIVSVGAILGLMASSFTSLMGQPRIFYRMAQDGLWFPLFGKVDPVTHVPSEGIVVTGIAAALLACFYPLQALANLISLGTLMVFTLVNGGVLVVRSEGLGGWISAYTVSMTVSSILWANGHWAWTACGVVSLVAAVRIVVGIPPRSSAPSDTFECPLVPWIPLGGIACNAVMMGSLPLSSWLLCGVWLVCGFSVYWLYGIRHSVLGKKLDETVAPLVDNRPNYQSTTATDISLHGVPPHVHDG